MTSPVPSLCEAGVTTRPLCTHAERVAAVRLYREVFDYGTTDPAVSTKLLAALGRYGGSAVGAFDTAGELLGFTYGFIGVDEDEFFHYSQAAVVAERVQGRGVGRVLKRCQAELARAHGLTSMRWAYDPMLARNAHFNLDVLGARGRWFVEDFYGHADAAGRSDRVIVQWRLDRPAPPADAEPPVAAYDLGWGRGRDVGDGRMIAVPADWGAIEEPATVARLRDLVAGEFKVGLSRGLVLTSCRLLSTASDTSVYLLRPAAEER